MKLESRNNSPNTWKAFDDNKTISRVSKKGESRLNWLGPHFIFEFVLKITMSFD